MKGKVVILLLMLIFFGCAKDRRISDGRFHSSFPEATVKINAAFRYLGQADYDVKVPSPDRTGELTYVTESHIYVPGDIGRGVASRGLDIRITTIRESEGTFVSSAGALKRALEHGTVRVGGRHYDYATWLVRPSMKGGNTRYLISWGYTMPACILVKEFKRDADARTRIKVVYWEDAVLSALSCTTLKEEGKRRSEKKRSLGHFNRRAAASFEILPSSER